MRLLITSLLVLLFTTITTTFVLRHPGYVLFSVGYYSIEMSLIAFLVAFLVVLVGYHVVVRSILYLWHLPLRLIKAQQNNRQQHAQRDLISGLLEAAQGNWIAAERLMVQSAAASSEPLIHYLLAARAAQQQGKYAQRDEYLLRAAQNASGSSFAVGLTKAELQLAQGQSEPALATLKQLYRHMPKNHYVLKLLSDHYRRLKNWDGLTELLPILNKAKVYTQAELQELEQLACEKQMAEAVAMKKPKLLRQLWKRLPAKLRNQEKIVQQYANHLCQLNENEIAERVLRKALNRAWSDTLVSEYGQVQLSNTSIQLLHGEMWLKEHGNSGALILSLARICRRAKLWGKARIYFESSLNLKPMPKTFCELADMLEQLGDVDSAQECCRKGLRLAVEGIAEPLRTRAEKYAEKQRESMLSEVLSREKAVSISI